MARRRNTGGNPIGVAILLALAAMAVVGPFAVAGWLIYNEVRARKYRGASKAVDLIAADERAALAQYDFRLAALDQDMRELQAEGDLAGFTRRGDGWFDARRVEARELNLQLGHLQAVRQELAIAAEELKSVLAERMEVWVRTRSGLIGARAGLLVFVGAFIWAVFASSPDVPGVAELLFGGSGDGGARAVASAGATVAAALASWIAGSATRAALVS